MTKWNYIFGVVTIGVIIGGTIYVIKKARDAEKLDEQSISVEEARDIVARSKGDMTEEVAKFESDISEVVNEDEDDEPADIPLAPMSVRAYELEDEEEEDDEGIEEVLEDEPAYGVSPGGLTIHPIEPLVNFVFADQGGIDPREDKELRYEKDSQEARHQFIKMELADWDYQHRVYDIMLQLFETTLYPTNVGDDLLRTQIIDYKAQFFGITSKWTKEVSFADLICHYARKATFEVGEFFPYWVEYFLQFNDFTYDMTSEECQRITLRLASHTYFNEERQTFGLFGLTRDSMDQAIVNASRNPDRSVTFEIEFQEFLKSRI